MYLNLLEIFGDLSLKDKALTLFFWIFTALIMVLISLWLIQLFFGKEWERSNFKKALVLSLVIAIFAGKTFPISRVWNLPIGDIAIQKISTYTHILFQPNFSYCHDGSCKLNFKTLYFKKDMNTVNKSQFLRKEESYTVRTNCLLDGEVEPKELYINDSFKTSKTRDTSKLSLLSSEEAMEIALITCNKFYFN